MNYAYCIIFVNGFKKDEHYILKEGDICTVRQMSGAVTGAIIGGVILTAGISAIGVGVAKNEMNKSLEEMQKDTNAKLAQLESQYAQNNVKSEYEPVSSIPTISGGRNQSQYGKPFPFVMGKSLYSPMYIGQPYTTISGEDGEEQTYHALFLLGYNDIEATDFKLGNIDLASNKKKITNGAIEIDSSLYPKSKYNTALEIQTSDEVSLYNQKVVQEDFNVEIQHLCVEKSGSEQESIAPEIIKFSSMYPQKVEVEFNIPGLIAYTDRGQKTEAELKVAVEYSIDGGATWLPFAQIGSGQTGITYNADTVYTVKENSSTTKSYKGVSVIKRQKPKQMRFVASKTFSYSDIFDSNGKCKLVNNVIEIRTVRINPSYQSAVEKGRSGYDLTNVSDTVYLNSIRTWCFDKKLSVKSKSLVPQRPIVEPKRKITTRVGFQIKADETLKGTLNGLNCIVQSKGRIWDKTTRTWSSTVAPTQNPASIALLALQSVMRGSANNKSNYAYPDSKLDLESFGEFYEWCDERGYYDSTDADTIRFACNGVLLNQKKTSDLVNSILACGRGFLVLHGKKYGIFIDKPRDTPVMILNNQNVISASNTKDFEDIPDRYEGTFVNERNNYTQDTGYAYLDESNRDTDVGDFKTEKITLTYQTNWSQVWANMRYSLAVKKLRPETWNRTIGIEGNLLEYGDLVEVQDDTLLVGIGEGCQIKGLLYNNESHTYITGIVTDGDFTIDDTRLQYCVKIMQTGLNGGSPSVLTKKVTFVGTDYINTFMFTEPISVTENILPIVDDTVSFGVYEKTTAMAVTVGKKSGDEGTFDITLMPYVAEVYTADLSKDNIPEFDSKITPPIVVKRGTEVTLYDLDTAKQDVIQQSKNYTNILVSNSQVKAVKVYYAKSADGQTIPSGFESAPNDTWTETIPTVSGGSYLWTCNTTIYGDDRKIYSCFSSRQGDDGKSAGMDSIILNEYIVRKDLTGSYSPSELTVYRQHFAEDGAVSIIPAVFELYVNGELKETKTTTDKSLKASFNYLGHLTADESLISIKVMMFDVTTSSNKLKTFLSQQTLPVVTDGENYTYGLRNQFIQYVTDNKGKIINSIPITTSAYVYKGFSEVSDWEYYDLPQTEAQLKGFKLEVNGHNLTITNVDDTKTPSYGSLPIQLKIPSVNNSVNILKVYLSWSKTAIDNRLVANSVPTPKGVISDVTKFPTNAVYGDYVLYVGATVGDFKKMHCYQWNDSAWVEDDNIQHTTTYLTEALKYLNDKDTDSDSYKFISNLFANSITAKKIGTQHLTLAEGGVIESTAKDSQGRPLIQLKDTGKAIFRDVEILGYATDSAVNNVKSSIETVDEKLSTVNENVSTLSSSVSRVNDNIESLTNNVDSVNDSLSAKQDAVVNGKTLIQGGYINTDIINVDSLFAREITATNMTLSENSIVEGNVDCKSLISGGVDVTMLLQLSFDITLKGLSPNIAKVKSSDFYYDAWFSGKNSQYCSFNKISVVTSDESNVLFEGSFFCTNEKLVKQLNHSLILNLGGCSINSYGHANEGEVRFQFSVHYYKVILASNNIHSTTCSVVFLNNKYWPYI